MTIAAFALLGVLSGNLALEAQASHTSLLTGEAFRLDVTFRASADIEVWLQHPNENEALRILIDDGTGPVRYVEAGRGIPEIVYAPARVRRFSRHRETFWLQFRDLDGGGVAPVFPAAGKYTIRVTYDAGRLHAASKALVFDVRAPEGTDAQLFERLRKRTTLLTPIEMARAIAEFPDSRYSPVLRLTLEGRREAAVYNFVQPDTGESLVRLDRQTYDALRRSQNANAARALMNAPPWPVLDEERLALVARLALWGGDGETAAEARRVLFARLPRSGAAADIREESRDAR